jgi:hypothetical protein
MLYILRMEMDSALSILRRADEWPIIADKSRVEELAKQLAKQLVDGGRFKEEVAA